MKIYLGVNSDGTEIMSKQKLKRYLGEKENSEDVMSFEDTRRPPHWMLDYTGVHVPKSGAIPIDVYLNLPPGSIRRMFGIDLTWGDECAVVEL